MTPRHILAHQLLSETSDELDFDWFLPNAGQRQLSMCLDYLRWNEHLTHDPLKNIALVIKSVRATMDRAWVHEELMECVRLGVVRGGIDAAIREWRVT